MKTKTFHFFLAINTDGRKFKSGVFLIPQSQKGLLLGQKAHNRLCSPLIQPLTRHCFLHCNQLLQGTEVHLHPKRKWWGCSQSREHTRLHESKADTHLTHQPRPQKHRAYGFARPKAPTHHLAHVNLSDTVVCTNVELLSR